MGFYLTTPEPAVLEAQPRKPESAYPRSSGVGSGLRFYKSGMGRWVNRDPIAVGGCSKQSCSSTTLFIGEYLFARNESISLIDILGLACAGCPSSAYPLWGPKIRVGGGLCGHEYRTNTDRELPKDVNGCGSVGTAWIPDSFLFIVSFTDCCDAHDLCYATCGKSKTGCDFSLGSCMKQKCNALWFMPPIMAACWAQTTLYVAGLTPGGWPAYETEQDTNCEWAPCCK